MASELTGLGNIMDGGFFSKNANDEIEIIGNHIHNRSECYPNLASAIRVSTTASAWGSLDISIASAIMVEVWSAAGAPSSPWDIHWMNIANTSANGQYQLVVYRGEAGSEQMIGCVRFAKTAVFTQEGNFAVTTPRTAASTRLTAALSSNNAAINSCEFSIVYHDY